MRILSILIEMLKSLLSVMILIPIALIGGAILTVFMMVAMLISLYEEFNRNIAGKK